MLFQCWMLNMAIIGFALPGPPYISIQASIRRQRWLWGVSGRPLFQSRCCVSLGQVLKDGGMPVSRLAFVIYAWTDWKPRMMWARTSTFAGWKKGPSTAMLQRPCRWALHVYIYIYVAMMMTSPSFTIIHQSSGNLHESWEPIPFHRKPSLSQRTWPYSAQKRRWKPLVTFLSCKMENQDDPLLYNMCLSLVDWRKDQWINEYQRYDEILLLNLSISCHLDMATARRSGIQVGSSCPSTHITPISSLLHTSLTRSKHRGFHMILMTSNKRKKRKTKS